MTKRTNNELQNITHKTKDRIIGGELRCSGRVAVPAPPVVLQCVLDSSRVISGRPFRMGCASQQRNYSHVISTHGDTGGVIGIDNSYMDHETNGIYPIFSSDSKLRYYNVFNVLWISTSFSLESKRNFPNLWKVLLYLVRKNLYVYI